MNSSSDRKWGILSSLMIHLLLFLLFLVVRVKPQTPPEEFIELAISNAMLVRADRYSPPPPTPKSSPPKTTNNTRQSRPKEVVKLPQRKMLEKEPAVIEPPPRERVYMEQDPARLSNEQRITSEPEREDSKPDLRERYIGRREDAPNPAITTGQRPLRGPESSEAGEGTSPARSFSIEWTGGDREKLRGDLPSYPQGLNKSAIIGIRFFVLPDGTVGRMIPLQKGVAALESLTLQALKNWRFNPLPSNAPQIQQQGIVNFIFRVE